MASSTSWRPSQFTPSQPFAILRGQGTGASFSFAAVAGPTLSIAGRQPVFVDVNLDGRLDWATVGLAPSPTSVFITSQTGRGPLSFGPAVEVPAPRNLLGVTALDLGGDGVPELIGADERHGAVTTFSRRPGLAGVARVVGPGDGVGDEVDWREERSDGPSGGCAYLRAGTSPGALVRVPIRSYGSGHEPSREGEDTHTAASILDPFWPLMARGR